MNIKIEFKYDDSGYLNISSDTTQYNGKIPSVVCLEQGILGKQDIYSIGVEKERVQNQLKSGKMELNKFIFIDPFSINDFNDRVIGMVVKYYCSSVHRSKFPNWWNLRLLYGIDHYCIDFYLPYSDSYLERVKSQLKKITSEKRISVQPNSN